MKSSLPTNPASIMSRTARSTSSRVLSLALAWMALTFLGAGARAADSPPGGISEIDFFESRIRPVLVESCHKCHSAEARKVKGGLRLDTREGILRGGESGLPAVASGSLEKSMLWRAVTRADKDVAPMPPGDQPLSEAQLADIRAWIERGAPMPESADGPPPQPAGESAVQRHWAFRPVAAVDPPQPKSATWAQSPIDAFILQRLEAAGIDPAPPADKRALIRRATYDLTGLPPSAEEVESFLADGSPDAFARVVDRLLASARYGERWGRHWLDVARYADTKGYVYGDREEKRFVHSYVYRDWVIDALNRDLPYDQFIKLQIAADQIVGDSPDPEARRDLAAMGFLTLGRRFLGVVHDIIDDRIDTVTRGTMGLTMACARCHDHKFDPIPTDDYYALYGVFSGSHEELTRVDPPSEASSEFDAEHRKRVDQLRSGFERRAAELSGRLRNQVERYLIASRHANALPTEEFYEIRGPEDLNPLIVRQWRAYLDGKPASDPVFGLWRLLEEIPDEKFAEQAPAIIKNALSDPGREINPMLRAAFEKAPPATPEALAALYAGALGDARSAWLEREAFAALTGRVADRPERLADPAAEQLRAVLYGADSPTLLPPGAIVDLEWWFDEPTRIELTKLQKAIDAHILSAKDAPRYSVIMKDRPEQRAPRVFVRGNPANPGRETERRFPILFGEGRVFSNGSGRLELANAIADPANPLTARVMVNRVWLHHFGAGMVRTSSDFGLRSEPPSHPELLDWLAARFIADGWSLKKLHRLIMLSSAYQQSSDAVGGEQIDPENRLLWRFNRRRLDFEETRDALLAASGELDPTRGGPAVEITEAPFPRRRTIYGYIDRQFLPGDFRVFDFPNPDLHNPQRLDTTVPQQALFFLNSPFMLERARALAAEATRESSASDFGLGVIYRRVFQREPNERELEAGRRFLQESPPVEPAPTPPPDRGWRYGYGAYDVESDRVGSFEELPHFTGEAWQGGESWPDGELGWARLTADGGHAGDDLKHAVIRRWIAPREGVVRISGRLDHFPDAGDGIRGRVVSSASGTLGSWTIRHQIADTGFEGVRVAEGETLDFIVDIRDNLNSDEFRWAPVIAMEDKPGSVETWDAKADFAGPVEPAAQPLTPLEKYAQAVLFSNEFVFVD